MTLYGYWRSSSAWRVRIALAWKRLPHEATAVHLLKDGGEQHGAAHRARNPLAQVPVLEFDDGTRLTQSVAIVEYLEERHPAPPLLPTDPLGRARVRQLVEIVNSGIQPLQNLAVLARVEALGVARPDWARPYIERGLDAFAELAATSAGTGASTGTGGFLVGDAPTLAEVFLIPQLYNARRFGLDVARWPLLERVEAACAALPAFRDTHPDRQPDAAP